MSLKTNFDIAREAKALALSANESLDFIRKGNKQKLCPPPNHVKPQFLRRSILTVVSNNHFILIDTLPVLKKLLVGTIATRTCRGKNHVCVPGVNMQRKIVPKQKLTLGLN